MELVVLGSGAAEAIPDPFCRCNVCETARREGGPEVRGRAAALLNDDLLIDLGPDIISAANRFDLYLGNLGTVLVTHSHSDHWLPSNLRWREPGFAATPVAPLTVYGPGDALDDVQPYLERATDLSVVPVNAGEQWTAGPYHITAVPATHGDERMEALLYVVDDGAHRLFYATDTSTLSQEAWDILCPLGLLDLILLDATSGLSDGGSGHHGFEKFIKTRARMAKEGLLGNRTRLVAHHVSHNGNLTYAQLVKKFAPFGVDVSYDGCKFML